ncbi:response regulator [Chondromyces apiculatus]|uniref:Signal transduction response regulator n=1 Tax=Chondromyces apiculatus DSM 436 TaxID=1192034 RepID=A0A017SWN1_9BACT|nr:response regulator [Chondromyces apiculatus]EYF01000.1 Signal transduction response regulator [Chondromyces apiculatus DSM 436]
MHWESMPPSDGPCSSEPRPGDPPPEGAAQRPYRILLVEDHLMSGDILVRRLRRRGYQVLWAQDGAEGVAMAASLQPDLVLMDLNLPVLDGIEAMERLKAMPATQGIPVIALTAHVTPEAQRRCLQAGAEAWEGKPVNFERLLARIVSIQVSQRPCATTDGS